MNAANTMLSTKLSYSRLNAASTCEPVFMARISSTMSCGFVSVTGDQSALVRRWIIWYPWRSSSAMTRSTQAWSCGSLARASVA